MELLLGPDSHHSYAVTFDDPMHEQELDFLWLTLFQQVSEHCESGILNHLSFAFVANLEDERGEQSGGKG